VISSHVTYLGGQVLVWGPAILFGVFMGFLIPSMQMLV